MTGIYVHVPFCARKCPYCDFYSAVPDKNILEDYTQALVRNIRGYTSKGVKADTLYFGGGTPSLLRPAQLDCIIRAAKDTFVLENAEITLEANPCTVTSEKLEAYLDSGINRLSLGVQSAVESELETLGRLHSFETAKKAVENAKKAGFENISCDIMLGTPGQTLSTLETSINSLLSLDIQHISAYMLKIEQGTAFDCDKIRNSCADDELSAQMYLKTVEMLVNAGFEQYEISNFARNGKRSRHNMKYWKGESYLGFGPSAHSFFDNVRYFCPGDTKAFITQKTQPRIVQEENPDKLEEYIMLALRLSDGIGFEKLTALGGNVNAVVQAARTFEKAGLCSISQDKLHLTPQGFLVSNGIISQLIESAES